jgi:hypothetical protein
VNKRNILLLLLVLGLAGGGAAYWYTFHKPHRNVAAEKAAYQLIANDLYQEFQSDEQAATSKYLDQVIQISGMVTEVSGDAEQGHSLILEADGAIMGGVIAQMAIGQPVENVQGVEVSLKGRLIGWEDLLGEIRIDQCTFVKP